MRANIGFQIPLDPPVKRKREKQISKSIIHKLTPNLFHRRTIVDGLENILPVFSIARAEILLNQVSFFPLHISKQMIRSQ